MENRQRKCKTPAKYEPISRHHHWTQAIRSLATTKACGVDHTTTHRPLPSEWISTSLQQHRDPRMRMWRGKGNGRSLSTKLWIVWWRERRVEKESWGTGDEIKCATWRQPNNKENRGICRENGPVQARSKIIQGSYP